MEAGEEFKNNFEIKDKTFDLEDSIQYHLLLHWDNQILKYLVMDPSTDVVLAHAKFSNSDSNLGDKFLEKTWSSSEILKREFKKVTLTFSGHYSCLIPSSFHSETEEDKFLAFSFGNKDIKTQNFKHPKIGAVMIAEIPETKNWFIKKYPNIKIYPNASLMIETLIRLNKFDKRNMVYLEVTQKNFEIYVFEKGAFKLFNTFKIDGQNDFVYHTLNVVQQLELDPKKTILNISGNIHSKHEYFNLLKEYFPNIELNSGLEQQNLALGISDQNKPEFAALYNLYSCAS